MVGCPNLVLKYMGYHGFYGPLVHKDKRVCYGSKQVYLENQRYCGG